MVRIIPSIIVAVSYYFHCCIQFVAAAKESSNSVTQTRLPDETCLKLGFDPSNLSCETCRLLAESPTLQKLQKEQKGNDPPIDLVAECRSCCQSYKVNPILHPGDSLRGKYKYALLTYNKNSLDHYGEIKDFIERDVNDVLSFKGENRFRVVATESPGMDAEMMRMMMMGVMMGGGGFGGPPKLMLFEKKKKGGAGWTEEDEEEAGEVISLRGWKREDIKDMLMTLLPSA
ncbi:hypothetical protein ACHAXS_011378 [Conticribra weissflogii]